MTEVANLDKYLNIASFGETLNEMQLRYIHSEAAIRADFKGNQGGGTGACMYDASLRFIGIHPIARRNILNKPVRFVSKVVPESDCDEQNQQYVELMRFLRPLGIVKKDITARSKIATIRDPGGCADHKAEFMASTQELDAFMSVQRSAYYQDEEIERIKWDESQVRLLKEGGDSSVSVTPAKGLDWMYDSIWMRAHKVFRSKAICDKFGFTPVEVRSNVKPFIECFCWATDDNPVMTTDAIERIFEGIDDPDELAMRRYGVFRQVSGRIYKAFDERVHKISADQYFQPTLFRSYWNYRIIDYHPSKPWDVSFLVIDPHNEWFVWNEIHQSHDNRTTNELRDQIKSESLLDEDEEFNRCTLIDPLATVKQIRPDYTTGRSVFDDLMSGPRGLRRLTPADTKNSPNGGRMNIKMRLKNAAICGKPGNNMIPVGEPEDPRYGYWRPTLWFMDNCRHHIEHFKNWRTVDYVLEKTRATKTVKRESEKWSDFCRNLEFLGSINPVWYDMHQQNDNYWEGRKFFQGQRAVANG
jgi:hypothetical protein